jgi:Holliday junction resolvase-like predicted endonuclease
MEQIYTIPVNEAFEDCTAEKRGESGAVCPFCLMRHRLEANEIDLILESETHLVFVEVKTRHASPESRTRYGRPAAAIDKGKRERMRKAAEDYLREHPTQKQPRIDVSEVYLRKNPDGTDEVIAVKLYPNAFAGR